MNFVNGNIIQKDEVMDIWLSSKGSFKNSEKWLKKTLGRNYMDILHQYGRKGVENLSLATPVDTGLTASSWRYEIEESDGKISINWLNSNVNKGVNIAIILQYGHGTGNGGYVVGRDYINPALRPIFDAMADKAWKEVVSTI